MSTTPKTPGQLVEYIAQVKRDQEAEWRRLSEADLQLQALTLWTVPGLVEAIAYGRVHIAPGHDPALTAPTSAREALDLAWELAHEVKEGQTIPEGTEFLGKGSDGTYLNAHIGVKDYRANGQDDTILRTLDPLPDPEPDWMEAPAVLARGTDWDCADPQVFSRENTTGTRWVRGTKIYRWDELTDVTPLYPKEARSESLPTDKDTGKHWAIRAIQATIGDPQ